MGIGEGVVGRGEGEMVIEAVGGSWGENEGREGRELKL